jgi:flagellar protein FliS
MSTSSVSLAYRKAALQQASTVGLVIALYDTLVGNLGRAASAIERNDIEGRCNELTHGFKVLQQLDLMLDMVNGGQAAINLRRFYSHLRGQMLKAQFKLSTSILQEQIQMVLTVRDAWQQVDSRENPLPGVSPDAGLTSVDRRRGPEFDGRKAAEGLGQSFSCSG